MIPLVVSSILIYNIEHDILLEKIQNQLSSVAHDRTQALKTLDYEKIHALQGTMIFVNEDNMIDDSNAGKNITQSQLKTADNDILQIRAATGGKSGYHNLSIINKHGITIWAQDRTLIGKDVSQDQLFINSIKGEGDNRLEFKDRERIIKTSAPMFAANDINMITPTGVVTADSDVSQLDTVLTDHTGIGNTGETFIVGPDHFMLSPSRLVKDAQFHQKVYTFPVTECFKNGKDVKGTYTDYRGKLVFGISSCQKDSLGYVVITKIDADEMNMPLITLEYEYITISGIIACLIVLIGYYLSNSISRPILELKKAAREISAGNFDVIIKIKGSNEISELARQFNTMRNHVRFTNKNLGEMVNERTLELKKSYWKLQKIMNTLDKAGLVSITDKNGNITYANEKFCEISKYTVQELIGQNHRIVKSGFHPPEFYEEMWDTLNQGKIWEGIIKNKAKDGTFYWVKTTIVPFFDESGNIEEYGSIRTDITKELELMEKIKKTEKLSIIGEMAARISHDLRNPLSVIRNTLEIIKIKNLVKDEELSNQIEKIKRAEERISHQIEDVLDYIRTAPLVLQSSDMRILLENVMNSISVPEKIKVNISVKNILIQCDHKKIEAVFTNLITNAIQAIGKQDGQIDIDAFEQDNQILITVKDSGPGIPEEDMSKIFEPLFTTKQVGTGLGLPSCKNIIYEHGWTIDVTSILGNGTTFLITIPKQT